MTQILFLKILLLVGGFGALYFGAECLVRGAARIASAMGMSPVVIGLTLVSLGTSAPELVVGVTASLTGESGLLVGNVLGSNLANIGLILGATALIRPLKVADRVISRDVPIMIFVTILVFPAVLDGNVDRGDGLILLTLLIVYVAFTFRTAHEDIDDLREDVDSLAEELVEGEGEERGEGRRTARNLLLVAVGALGLALGGWSIVDSAVYLAGALGASPEVVGLTVVAIGTSLPELVTSLVAAIRKETDIAVGNVVGSNIFNLAGVLGASALVGSYPVGESLMSAQMPAVLILSVLTWPIVASARTVRRWEGLLLLIGYFVLVGWLTLV